ncbi:hypothetical protein QUA79_20115 [Microcoleus sp. F8-D1]
MDVRVTIYLSTYNLTYRQGTSGVWQPIPTTPNDAIVSTATQFSSGGVIYKWTKGSWLNGASYSVKQLSGQILQFRNDKQPDSIVQYNP